MGLTQKLGTIPLAIQTDSSNNVGIGGTPSGSFKLEVTGASKLSGFLGVNGSPATSFPFEAYINSATAYSSTSRGNVMRVYNSNTGANVFAGIELGGAGTANDGLAGINAVVTGSGSAALTMYTRNDGTFSEKLRVTSAGNVGIGTSNPALTTATRTTLDIGNASESLLVLSTGGSWRSYFYNDGTNLSIANSGGFINFDVLGERMRITNTGRVGIGTSTPTGLLDVANRGITKGSMPSGSVIQVVTFQLNSGASTSGSTDIDTGLNASITPTSSTSKILVIVSANLRAQGTGGNAYVYGKIWRGAVGSGTAIYDGFAMMGNYASSDIRGIGNATILDSPATTSSVTYRFSINSQFANTASLNSTTSPSTITLMEIAQ